MNKMLLEDLERLSKKPASLLNTQYWFPLALYGVLSFAAAAVFFTWDPAETNSWLIWAILGPLGGIVTGIWFSKQSVGYGIDQRNPAIYVALWVFGAVGCSLAGIFLEDFWIFPTVLAIVGVINLVLGVLDQAFVVAVVGVGLVCIGILGGVGEVRADIFNLIVGIFLLSAAVIQKSFSEESV